MTTKSVVNQAQSFNLSIPLYMQGGERKFLAQTDKFSLAIASCANGFGEKELHRHADEDHAFVVLCGRARFIFEHQDEIELRRWGGLFIPRGVVYAFEALEDLVLLRAGAQETAVRGVNAEGVVFERTAPDGTVLARDSVPGVREEAIVAGSRRFPFDVVPQHVV